MVGRHGRETGRSGVIEHSAPAGEHVTDMSTGDSSWRHYIYDGNGYVRQTVNENAEPTFAWTFSPEGAVILGEEGPVTHLSCTGDAIYDFSTGLIYKNGRYYDPSQGIWLSTGAVGIVMGLGQKRGNRAQRRRERKLGRGKKHLWLILFVLLILLLVGCNESSALDVDNASTKTCTPTPTATSSATLPPPFISVEEQNAPESTPPYEPPDTPEPPPTVTPLPTNTPTPESSGPMGHYSGYM